MAKPATEPDFVLYSDGGSSSGGLAAGACVLRESRSGNHSCYAIALGVATNNEAEIFAALLGFAAIHAASAGKTDGVSVRWVADSEYLLKSSTGYIFNWQRNGWKTADKKPVKNQGLWQTYLTLSAGLKIEPEHVRGHTGHVENESCDEAVRWLKAETENIFIRKSFCQAEISTPVGDDIWLCLDGRELMENLRSERPDEEYQLGILELLKEASGDAQSTVRRSEKPKKDPLKPVLEALETAWKHAEKAAKENEAAQDLSGKIRKLMDGVLALQGKGE